MTMESSATQQGQDWPCDCGSGEARKRIDGEVYCVSLSAFAFASFCGVRSQSPGEPQVYPGTAGANLTNESNMNVNSDPLSHRYTTHHK